MENVDQVPREIAAVHLEAASSAADRAQAVGQYDAGGALKLVKIACRRLTEAEVELIAARDGEAGEDAAPRITFPDCEPTDEDLASARATIVEDVATTGIDRTVDRMIEEMDHVGRAYAAGHPENLARALRRSGALLRAFQEHRAADTGADDAQVPA